MRKRAKSTVERIGRFGAVLAAVMALAAPAAAQDGLRPIDETMSLDADGTVEIEVTMRDVRVTGWDRSEVRVRGSSDPEREEFRFEREDWGLRVELELDDEHDGYDGWSADELVPLEISVPRGASVEVELVSGPLAVEGVEGPVQLETVSGNVRYEGGSESVRAESVSGAIDVRAPRSRDTRGGSVSGSVVLRVAGGRVAGESVSGDLEIHAGGPVREVSGESVSGTVTFTGRPASSGDLSFESHSGDLVVRLPADFGGALAAETFSGSIESAFGGEARRESQYTPGKSFRHTVGSGGASVSAESFSGTVRFVRSGG